MHLKTLINNSQRLFAFALVVAGICSCNEELPIPQPIVPATSGTISIGQALTTLPDYSLLRHTANRAGLLPYLSNPSVNLTVFAPNNAAFIASGLVDTNVINTFPAATLATIVNYHMIPGEKFTASRIGTGFPNVQLPTNVTLEAPFVKMSLFASRRGTSAWVNNIPVTATDIQFTNGVVHNVARVVMPPSLVLAQTAAADTNLTFFLAGVARADVGIAAGSRFADILANPLASLTVFAPTNGAFRNLFTLLGLPATTASFASLPSATVRGILAYHLLSVRVFAANLPSGDNTVTTLIGTTPQLQLRVALPSVQLRGPGNVIPGTTTPFYANVTAADIHAINGVIHRIDNVVLPQ